MKRVSSSLIQRQVQRHDAAEGMRDDEDARQANGPQPFRDEPRLRGGAGGAIAQDAIAPAMAGPVKGEDAIAARSQGRGERRRHIGLIAGGAMQQQHCRARRAVRQRVGVMQPPAFDSDEFAGWRIARFQRPRLPLGEQSEPRRCKGEEQNEGEQHAAEDLSEGHRYGTYGAGISFSCIARMHG